MPWLLLNGRKYSFDELPALDVVGNLNPFEKSTLTFCQNWLCNKSEFVIQTSGSTGAPKSIVLKRAQLEASARQTIDALQLKSTDTALVCLDTMHIAGQMMLVRSMMAGMNTVAVDPSSSPFDQTNEQVIDFVALVPYQLENTLLHQPKKLDRVRCAIVGGAAISNSLMEKIKGSHCALHATYGMTETISHIALQKLNGPDAIDYFQAFPSINLRLDHRGCLCIKAKYLDEELITNDLVEFVGERTFRWLGRIDNVINSGGVKIIPEKVEMVFERILDSFQINNRFFVAGTTDEKLGTKVTLFMEGALPGYMDTEKIIQAARPLLAPYELPREFHAVARFKETPTGKINRVATIAARQ